MNELEEYMSHYWEGYDGESDLIGLTPGGFNSEKELSISNFDKAQLDWALDLFARHGHNLTGGSPERTPIAGSA